MNIITMLKNAKVVLFTDDEYFNKDITGVKNLSDIKDWVGIHGNIKKLQSFNNKIVYGLGIKSYNFTLTFIS